MRAKITFWATALALALQIMTAQSAVLAQPADLKSPVVTGPSGGTGGATAKAPTAKAQASKTPASRSSPAGNYVSKVNPPGGTAKLLANGTVICSSGEKGTWEVVDADTRTYVISVAGGRYNVIFQPGTGFVDAIDKNLLFEAK